MRFSRGAGAKVQARSKVQRFSCGAEVQIWRCRVQSAEMQRCRDAVRWRGGEGQRGRGRYVARRTLPAISSTEFGNFKASHQ